MFKPKMTILMSLLLLTTLVLTACGSAPEAVDPEPEVDVGLDGEWLADDTPPYPYAQAMRERLDPMLDQAFGIEEVQYSTIDAMNTYNVRYALQNVPEGEAFYFALEEVLTEVFDIQAWGDFDTAGSYFDQHDELPDVIGVSMNFEDSFHFWNVAFDGTYLIFATV